MALVAVEVLTPSGSVYNGEVNSIRVPGVMGSFAVLSGHAPLISPLDKGQVLINTPNETLEYTIEGGVVEVLDNHVVVLAEKVIHKS